MKIILSMAPAIMVLVLPMSSVQVLASSQRYIDVFPNPVLAQSVAEGHQNSLYSYSGLPLTANSKIYGGRMTSLSTLEIHGNVASLDGLEQIPYIYSLRLIGENNTFTEFANLTSTNYLYSVEISSYNLSSLASFKFIQELIISNVSSSMLETFPLENNNISALTLIGTDIDSFDFLSNISGLRRIHTENTPNINDFSSPCNYASSTSFSLVLKDTGVNNESGAFNMQSLFTGNITNLSELTLDGINADFTGINGQGTAKTVQFLSLTNMDLTNFPNTTVFERLSALTLTDTNITSFNFLGSNPRLSGLSIYNAP